MPEKITDREKLSNIELAMIAKGLQIFYPDYLEEIILKIMKINS